MSLLDLSNVPAKVTLENTSGLKKKIFLAKSNSTYVLEGEGGALKVKAKDSSELLSYLRQGRDGVKVSTEIYPILPSGGDTEALVELLETKLDKVTSSSVNPRVYGITEEGGQATYFATQTPNANTIPLRDASGRFQVADGVAPKQAINKAQLDTLAENINLTLQSFAVLDEQNSFSESNTFKEVVQFDKGLEADRDIVLTNSAFKTMSNSNGDDHVAQYTATGIKLEENGTTYNFSFPTKSGTLATLADIQGSGVVPFNFSEFGTENLLGSKSDFWKLTDDDASLSVYHENTTSLTTFNLSKNHIGMQAVEELEEDKKSYSVLAFSSDAFSLGVANTAENKSNFLVIDKDKVQLNDKDLALKEDLDVKINRLTDSAVNEVYARNGQSDGGIPFTYSAEANTIAYRSAAGTLAVEIPTQDNDAANKKFVETKCASIPKGISISDVSGSVKGSLTTPDFDALQQNPNYYILKDGKVYTRSSERTTLDSISYVCNGYLNNDHFQEVIEITISAKAWVLNSGTLLTTKTYANGKVGGVSVKSDFADGLEVSQTNGNLSIYGAVDENISSRASKRPITPTNLNKAVLAALTDDSHIIPSEAQQAAFKAAWGFTASMLDAGIKILDLTEISENATDEATSGNIKADYWDDIIAEDIICLKLNNEYYLTSDDGHTPGIKSFSHVGWNGNSNQTKSINITLETKAWTLKVGLSKYYKHYIKITLIDDKVVYYDFPSLQATAYTMSNLPVQPDDSHSQFTLVVGSYYSTVNGQLYRSGDQTLKIILNGLYTSDGSTVSYLSLTGTEVKSVVDTPWEM